MSIVASEKSNIVLQAGGSNAARFLSFFRIVVHIAVDLLDINGVKQVFEVLGHSKFTCLYHLKHAIYVKGSQ